MTPAAAITIRLDAPKSWDRPLDRACYLCHHGATVNARRVCRNPAVVAPHDELDVGPLRQPSGPCGPEANFLDFPGLRP